MVSSTTVSIILLIVLIAPTLAFYIGSVAINIAEYTKGDCDFPEGVCIFGTMIGFPSGWLRTDKFIWYAIIPIMGVWLTVYGFMKKIQIFNEGIMAGLSFIIAFSTIPLGLFVVMVVALYQLMGIYATMGLAILFFVGLFFELRNRIGGMSGENAAYQQQIKGFTDDLNNTKKRLREVEDLYKKAVNGAKKHKNVDEQLAIRGFNEMKGYRDEAERLKNEAKTKDAQIKRFKTLWQKSRK